jgi:branched-chain amino acid transport system substrate-binding protein
MEMFRGFEQSKSFDPMKVSAALLANKGQFNTVKGPARWREDHAAEYKHAAFLVRGKGPKEQKNEWDLFTVLGSVGGDAVLPTMKSLGY